MIEGFSLNIFKHAALGFPLAFIYALVGDIFIVGKIVKIITSKILKPNDDMKKVGVYMSFFTSCGMVIWMSLFGVITNIGLNSNFISAYSNAHKHIVFHVYPCGFKAAAVIVTTCAYSCNRRGIV